MADTLTPEQRRRCMSNVRNKNTGLEMKLRRALWKTGLRYRVNSKQPGKPDIVFPKRKLAVFVDGCFWHGCPIHGTKPETNAEFWQTKIKVNRERDLRVTSQLTDLGWTVIRVWEHEIKECLAVVIQNITEALDSA
ncbi:MAG: very short patch repair endonuclease [Methylobacter sp.]